MNAKYNGQIKGVRADTKDWNFERSLKQKNAESKDTDLREMWETFYRSVLLYITETILVNKVEKKDTKGNITNMR